MYNFAPRCPSLPLDKYNIPSRWDFRPQTKSRTNAWPNYIWITKFSNLFHQLTFPKKNHYLSAYFSKVKQFKTEIILLGESVMTPMSRHILPFSNFLELYENDENSFLMELQSLRWDCIRKDCSPKYFRGYIYRLTWCYFPLEHKTACFFSSETTYV